MAVVQEDRKRYTIQCATYFTHIFRPFTFHPAEGTVGDGKTVIEQTLTDITVEEQTDEIGNITLHIEASVPKTFPDVKPEGGSDSGFDVGVDDWEDDQQVDIPV